jgi:hypothetical protein
VDEFMHISRRMRRIALQSAVGGMLLSIAGMLVAAAGHLSPVGGAVSQEVIDVLAVLNALRAAVPPRAIQDIPVYAEAAELTLTETPSSATPAREAPTTS